MRTILCALAVFIGLALPALGASRDISAAEAATLLQKKPQTFILDVRTPEEFRQGHLPGAVLIPISELGRRLGEVPRNRPVLVYCAVGSRSRSAAEGLAQNGYGEVYNLAGGIFAWSRAGYPVKR